MQRRILIAENNNGTQRQLKPLLESDPEITIDTGDNEGEVLEALSQQNYSVLLTDLQMPCLDGMHLIEEIQKRDIPVSVIAMAGPSNVDLAVKAMRLGADDFLSKPIDNQQLRLVIKRVLRERLLQDEVGYLREQLKNHYAFHNILSKNPRMHAVFELISNVAQTNTTVLIEGETGTGKEEVARALHQTSQVRTGPMVAVNCAAIPETLLESELFGHERGAFTGAVQQRRGRFEMAHGGTIFLDEVGDIPAPMQAKLLRVLQERCFERVGGVSTIEADVRVIAATNRPLQRLVQENKFREDLYYRLNVVKIELPPLRDRREDIPLLAELFARKYARQGEPPKSISPQCMDALLNYSWPGNIRELENAIERACVTSQNGVIGTQNLPPDVLHCDAPKAPSTIDLNRPLPEVLRDSQAEIEKLYIHKALEKCRGHVGLCADICGLSRRSLSAKITTYGIDKNQFKNGWKRPRVADAVGSADRPRHCVPATNSQTDL